VSQAHELAPVSQAHELAAVSHSHDVSHGHDPTFLQSASHVVRPPSGVTPPYSSHPAPASHAQLVVFASQCDWHEAGSTESAPEQKLSSTAEHCWPTLHSLGTFCALLWARRAFRSRAAVEDAAARCSSAATAAVNVCGVFTSAAIDRSMRFRSSTEAYIVLAWVATSSPSEAIAQLQNAVYLIVISDDAATFALLHAGPSVRAVVFPPASVGGAAADGCGTDANDDAPGCGTTTVAHTGIGESHWIPSGVSKRLSSDRSARRIKN
jgi:hypothetical protein